MKENPAPTISPDMVSRRLTRFREAIDRRGVAAAVLHDPVTIRHLTGAASAHGWPSAVVLSKTEAVGIFFASGEQPAEVDRQIVLKGTRPDRAVHHLAELSEVTFPILQRASDGRAPLGLDAASAPGWLWTLLSQLGIQDRVINLGDEVADLRRCKDPDELAVIRYNVRLAEAGYEAALQTIRPGGTELDVYQAMSEAVNSLAGTSVPMGGDFASGPGGGSRGGSPTRRVLADGDSYVIDFWPHLGDYYADMCRTFTVGEPGPALQDAIELAVEGLRTAESIIKPGVAVAEVDAAVRNVLDRRPDLGGGAYFHPTGHGIGLAPHEAPWLSGENDETFRLGDVIAVEPGLYAESLNGGVRIEDNYLVVEGGVENLCSFPRVMGQRR